MSSDALLGFRAKYFEVRDAGVIISKWGLTGSDAMCCAARPGARRGSLTSTVQHSKTDFTVSLLVRKSILRSLYTLYDHLNEVIQLLMMFIRFEPHAGVAIRGCILYPKE